MEITQQKLYSGLSTNIKNKSYLSTSEYTQPFFEQMSKFTDKFCINVQPLAQTTISDKENTTFNRVNIIAKLDSSIDEYNEIIGLIYALDIKTPVYKIYRAMMNSQNNSILVFDKSWQSVHELKENTELEYDIERLMNITSTFKLKLDALNNTKLSSNISEIHQNLGRMIELSNLIEHTNISGKVKLSNSIVIDSYNDTYTDISSKYYTKPENQSSILNFHNAFTNNLVKDKDLVNKFEKTLLINQLFNI